MARSIWAQPILVNRSKWFTVHSEVGELVLRGETIMKCYWNRPEATAETIRDGCR